mgnify:CR=1 FL=1
MIKRAFFVAVLLGLIPSIGFAVDVVAKASAWGGTFSVNAEGDAWDKSCKLTLMANTYDKAGNKLKREISLKREGVNCALHGPVHIYAADTSDRESVIVFFEASRGGDGDHSGPIVEVFKLTMTNSNFQKLGEEELFDATYHRKNEQITSVTGTVLYSLCQYCDGPSDTEDDFYIPAIMTIGQSDISVKPTISKQEHKSLLEKFDARAAIAIKENDFDKKIPNFIKAVRKEMNTFLRR